MADESTRLKELALREQKFRDKLKKALKDTVKKVNGEKKQDTTK